jgi:hypothetical protein
VRYTVACIPNIGPGERRKRLRMGVIALGASVVLAAALVAGGADRRWRLVLFLPLWFAELGVFQAKEKT